MTKRTRHRDRPAHPPPRPELDDAELDLRELGVLWPRLKVALARDGAGPSAEPTGSSSTAGRGSPAVLDLDTERTLTLITVGVHDIEAQAIRILNVTPAVVVLGLLRQEVTRQSALGDTAEVHRLQQRIARVEWRRTTAGVLERMPLWYAQLRDRQQPLADEISRDSRRWVRQAREVLRLRTREVPIGWVCPHHRDAPAVLVRDADEATLADSVLTGRAQAAGEAPLTWRRAESVHCRRCGQRWSGVEQLRILMLMIERADASTGTGDSS